MLQLNRYTCDLFGTYGVFVYKKRPLCHTFELPWSGIRQAVSCIPVGEYVVRKVVSEKFGDCFYVDDVPGRSGILIHCGNTKHDTRGCILPGLDINIYNHGVLHSRLAMQRLNDILPLRFEMCVRYT